jgi:aerobic carbon-monoxide dehydrogenase medium subunit
MGSTPVRAPDSERALVGQTAAGANLGEVAQIAVRATQPPDDVHGTTAYRKRIGAHLVERVLARALQEATSAPS